MRVLQAKNSQARQESLTADIMLFEEEQEKKLQELAAQHGRTYDYINSLLKTSSHYKAKRAPSLQNAKIHYMSMKLNSGLCPFVRPCCLADGLHPTDLERGHRYNLQQLRELAQQDSDLQDLTEAQVKGLTNALQEQRELKKNGARASNRAAAHDVLSTMSNIGSEASSLYYRWV